MGENTFFGVCRQDFFQLGQRLPLGIVLISDKKIAEELVRLRTESPVQWILSYMNQEPGGWFGFKYHPWLDIWFLEDNVIKFALPISTMDNIKIKKEP
jgi:hypothetical protein